MGGPNAQLRDLGVRRGRQKPAARRLQAPAGRPRATEEDAESLCESPQTLNRWELRKHLRWLHGLRFQVPSSESHGNCGVEEHLLERMEKSCLSHEFLMIDLAWMNAKQIPRWYEHDGPESTEALQENQSQGQTLWNHMCWAGRTSSNKEKCWDDDGMLGWCRNKTLPIDWDWPLGGETSSGLVKVTATNSILTVFVWLKNHLVFRWPQAHYFLIKPVLKTSSRYILWKTYSLAFQCKHGMAAIFSKVTLGWNLILHSPKLKLFYVCASYSQVEVKDGIILHVSQYSPPSTHLTGVTSGHGSNTVVTTQFL